MGHLNLTLLAAHPLGTRALLHQSTNIRGSLRTNNKIDYRGFAKRARGFQTDSSTKSSGARVRSQSGSIGDTLGTGRNAQITERRWVGGLHRREIRLDSYTYNRTHSRHFNCLPLNLSLFRFLFLFCYSSLYLKHQQLKMVDSAAERIRSLASGTL